MERAKDTSSVPAPAARWAACAVVAACLGMSAPAAAQKLPSTSGPARAEQVGRAEPAPAPGLADSVWLRDGARLRGTVLRVDSGNYVLLLGAQGVRTIPWRSVVRIEDQGAAPPAPDVALAAALASPSAPPPCCSDDAGPKDTAPAEDRAPDADDWAAASLGWDLRAEGISLFKSYTVGGRQVWYGGEGVGGGASVSVHFRGPAWLGGASGVRWVELELGAGDSIHYVSWKEGAQYQTEFIENQTSLIIGTHFASGRWSGHGGSSPWSGVVVGLAWLPTYVQFFGSDDFEARGKFHPGGLRLTADWGRVSPSAKGLLPGFRAVLTWLPYVGDLPSALSAGLGCVFY